MVLTGDLGALLGVAQDCIDAHHGLVLHVWKPFKCRLLSETCARFHPALSRYIFNNSSFSPLTGESILSELAGEVPAPMELSRSFVGVGNVLPVPSRLLGADAGPLEASDLRSVIPWIVSKSAVCSKETEETDDGSQGINT